TFRKKLGSFREKRSVFNILHFKSRKVQNLSVKFGLAKIWNQNHIQRESIIDSIFQIHSTVENGFGFAVIIIYISRNIRLKGKSCGRLNIFNSIDFTIIN